MTIFALKLIALTAMLINHVAAVLGEWDLLPFDTALLWCIGRIAYPIFAFCLVNGWKYTRDRRKYFSNLALCALFSQAPFSLAFYTPNLTPDKNGASSMLLLQPLFLITAVFCIAAYWYFALRREMKASLLVVSAACLLPVILLKINHIWILAETLNVLYTLALGAAILFVCEKAKDKSLKCWELSWLILTVTLAAAVYGISADYGFGLMGLALIVALYAVSQNRLLQSAVIVVWGCFYYGMAIGNWGNAFAVFAPALMILFHNHSRGYRSAFAKHLFYWFYPLHMLAIGIINVCLKYGLILW